MQSKNQQISHHIGIPNRIYDEIENEFAGQYSNFINSNKIVVICLLIIGIIFRYPLCG